VLLTLPPLVKRENIVRLGAFTDNDFAFLATTLLMNRKRHTIPVDLDQESLQFEIIATCARLDVARLYRFFRTGVCAGLIGRGTGSEYTGAE
jgi:hypothetical protein